jgi:hypothetical protein
VLLGLWCSPVLSQPADAATKEATDRFFAGQKLYEAANYEEALAELRASYAAVKSPNSHLYIARCLRNLAIASGGLGVVGFVLAGAFAAQAQSRYDDLQRRCGGRCGPSYQDEVDAGRRESAASTAGLVIGIVGLAGSAALFTIDLTSRKPAGQGGGGTKTSLRVVPSPAAPFVTVSGVF